MNKQTIIAELLRGNQERVDDFKYFGSMVATEEKDMPNRKG